MYRALFFFCLSFSLAGSALAQHIGTLAYQVTRTTNAPATLPPGDRFLFLVDTSFSMHKLDAANRQALFEMIFSGLRGRMKDGDTYGIWTVNEQTYTGLFPMQTWKQEETMQQASRAALFLKQQPYEHDTQMSIAFVKLDTVIRAVHDLNILILSDGDTILRGTPFDSAINAEYEKRSAQRKRAKLPFVTAFVAREGKLISATVTIAGEAIQLPERAEPPAIAKTPAAKPEPKPVDTTKPKGIIISLSTNVTAPQALVTESTNASQPSLTFTPSNAPPAAAATATDVVAGGHDLDPPKETVAPTKAPAPERTALASEPAATAPAVEQKPVAPNLPAGAVLEEKTPALNDGPATIPPGGKSRAALHPAPLIVSAREVSTVAPSDHPAATPADPVAPSSSFFSPGALFLTGLGLLVVAMGLLLFCVGRFRPAAHPSLISQSMERR